MTTYHVKRVPAILVVTTLSASITSEILQNTLVSADQNSLERYAKLVCSRVRVTVDNFISKTIAVTISRQKLCKSKFCCTSM